MSLLNEQEPDIAVDGTDRNSNKTVDFGFLETVCIASEIYAMSVVKTLIRCFKKE